MAAGQIKVTEQKQPATVYCGECQFFVRDTDGINRNAYTGEFFMGVCTKGLHPDTAIKQFANKPRHCEKYGKTIHT